MQKTKRNKEAEAFKGTLIPKDSTLCVGVESVAVFQNTVMQGDYKGRKCDKYKVTLCVLEPGEFKDARVSLSLTAQTERRVDGSGAVVVDNYGNSKKYVQFLQAIDPSIDDDNLPMPESDDEAKEWGESWIGNVLNVTFGTYNFKNTTSGENVTVNTMKDAFKATQEQIDAIMPAINLFLAGIAAKRGGGAADNFDPDDFID